MVAANVAYGQAPKDTAKPDLNSNRVWAADSLQQRIEDGELKIELAPYEGPVTSIGWSPKGTKFDLRPNGKPKEGSQELFGKFSIGDQATVKVRFRLETELKKSKESNGAGGSASASVSSSVSGSASASASSSGSGSAGENENVSAVSVSSHGMATLAIDLNGDGQFETGEEIEITPEVIRKKVWYSTRVDLMLPGNEDELEKGERTRKYPIALWFVKDPMEPDEPTVMRWSTTGWQSGVVSISGKSSLLVVGDANKDGLFTKSDRWGLIPDDTIRASSKDTFFRVDSHAWMKEVPYRMLNLDRYGRSATIEAFDLGISRAAEMEANDRLAADKRAPRAKIPLVFLEDFEEAMELAKKEEKLVFVDFVTEWCGPCKVMDKLVYTAASTVKTCNQVICVKLDGDEHKALVERFGVEGFPHLLLLTPDGKVVDRRSGYQSVKKLNEWINGAVKKREGEGQAPKAAGFSRGEKVSLDAIQNAEFIEGIAPKSWKKDELYILDCWATWCGPCVAGLPKLKEVHDAFHDKGVNIIAMNVWEDDKQRVANFVEKNLSNMPYPVAYVGEGGVFEKQWLKPAGVTGIPHVFDLAFAEGDLENFDKAVGDLKDAAGYRKLVAPALRAVITEDWEALERFCETSPRKVLKQAVGQILSKVKPETFPESTTRAVLNGLWKEGEFYSDHPAWFLRRARFLWALGEKEEPKDWAEAAIGQLDVLAPCWQEFLGGNVSRWRLPTT